ncbi:hypothetical protein [Allofustis seminis]|uniref:hypothetical protein n=1 Tax=Allofustis seminis TaxID=166939 RepID=UPI000369AC11|nr:hypothetical protein [Allofustis seminis]
MTNKELKRQTFLEATKRYKEQKRGLYEREPERELYDNGKIGWNEYVKLSKKRKDQEREKYQRAIKTMSFMMTASLPMMSF